MNFCRALLTLLLAACAGLASAATPENLDALVDGALHRDPEALAWLLDSDAARERAAGARQFMSPQLMVAANSVGAMMDSPDPQMYMVGVSEMFSGRGERRARSQRQLVEVSRGEAQRERVAADLRLRFWQAAARLEAWKDEITLIDEQVEQARALERVSLARYAAGAPGADTAGAPPMNGGGQMEGSMSVGTSAPPRIDSRSASAAPGAMPGMAGSTGASSASGLGAASMSSAEAINESRPSMPATSPMSASPASLPELLRLNASVARLRADLAGLEARRDGEIAVLALFVGDDVARVVAVQPSAYLGRAPLIAPERRLAAIESEAAAADLDIARARRQPDVMISTAARIMPEGKLDGFDIAFGIEIPVGSGLRHDVAAGTAAAAAAAQRERLVARDIAVSAAMARASLRAADARALALASVAVPRSNVAFDASRRMLAAGSGSLTESILAWSDLLSVRRELIATRREAELRAAELARVEGER